MIEHSTKVLKVSYTIQSDDRTTVSMPRTPKKSEILSLLIERLWFSNHQKKNSMTIQFGNTCNLDLSLNNNTFKQEPTGFYKMQQTKFVYIL